jgi:hypothetical protein
VITDPTLNWDKRFISPGARKQTKATLDDRATFWRATAIATTGTLQVCRRQPAGCEAATKQAANSSTQSKITTLLIKR